MSLTDILNGLKSRMKRVPPTATFNFKERRLAKLEEYMEKAQASLNRGDWSNANQYLDFADLEVKFGAGKHNSKIQGLRKSASKIGLEHEMKYARLALTELLYREEVAQPQDFDQRRAGIDSLVNLMTRPEAIDKLDYTWVISALNTAKSLANRGNLKLPDDYSTLERTAYEIGVSIEMKYAIGAIGMQDYVMANHHLGNVQRNAKKAGVEVPSDFEELQRQVDFYVKPEKLVSEEVKGRYDLEFNVWYQNALGSKTEERFAYNIASLEHGSIVYFGPELDDFDAYLISTHFLGQIKRESRDNYFRMVQKGVEHPEAFEASVKPLGEIIASVKDHWRMPHAASQKIQELGRVYAVSKSCAMEGP